MARLRETHKAALRRWMWSGARGHGSTKALFDAFCEKVVQVGVPIERALLSVRTIHPQILATGYLWTAGRHVTAVDRGHDIANDPDYLSSTFKQIHDGAESIRRRLGEPAKAGEPPLMADLRQQGFTDYVAIELVFTDQTRNAISFATRVRGGFGDDHLDFLREMLAPLTLLVEIQAERKIASVLLDTYVGHQAGARILRGDIRRGVGEPIRAVIWYGDLRGFTEMSNTQPTREVIAALNAYFDTMASAIHKHGGQVLKFMGDGVFAIFPVVDAGFRDYTTRQTVEAAIEVGCGMARINDERAERGLAPLRFGLGLHIGELVYGNIGAVDRLDFTAIGPAVNLTARLEELSSELGRPIVMSAEFAALARNYIPVEPAGRHALRGIHDAVEVFSVDQVDCDRLSAERQTAEREEAAAAERAVPA